MAWCCMLCLNCFKEQKTLNRHVRGKHLNTTFSCIECTFTSDRVDFLKRHMESKHFGIQLSCSKCSFSCDRKDSLSRHIKTHHGVDPLLLTTVSDRVKDVEMVQCL